MRKHVEKNLRESLAHKDPEMIGPIPSISDPDPTVK